MDMSGMDAHAHSVHVGFMGMAHASHRGHGPTVGLGHWLPIGVPSPLGMYAAHLAAAVLCGLWLGYGEHFAYRMLRASATWLTAPLRLLLILPTPCRGPRALVRRGGSSREPRRLLLVHAITSRGPPLGPAVV
ncbi:hypothetical protein [Streptomyces palmae]